MKEADLLVRHLGGDLSLIQEIKNIRAQQEALPTDHPARIFGEDVEAQASKRSLDDDMDIYNAKKQKLLAEIEAEKQRTLAAIKADVVVSHATFTEKIAERLSSGNPAPATLQIVLQMRHTLTAQLASMAESITARQTALPGPQHGLSALAQAQRLTVQMFASQRGVPAKQQTEKTMGDVGKAAGQIWAIEQRLTQVEQLADGSWILVRYVGSTMRGRDSKVQEAWEPEWTDETFSQKRIKYSSAYRGGMEQTNRAPRDTWTYPKELGSVVLADAFSRCKL